MKIVKILKLLPYALVTCGLTAWGGWIDELKKTSTYDSSTGVYTLTGDFSVYTISGQDAKVDLNGHSFAFSGLSSNLELLNSSSTRAQVTINGSGLGEAGKTLVIGSGVDLLKLLSKTEKVFVGGTMKLCEGSRCYFEGIACVDKHNDDARTYFQVIFYETANVIVEPGAMLKQYVDPNEAQSQADWYTWYNKEGFADLCVQEGWVPESYELQGPDSDGYYLVGAKPMPEVVSEAELSFSADVATGTRTVEKGVAQNFAYSLTAWGATAEQAAATVTYTYNGGASQTLGSYTPAIAETATWLPEKSGTYVFTHQPGGLTATIVVPQKPTIIVESVRQQYPFNKVDVQYLIEELDPSATYSVELKSVVDGVTNAVNIADLPATEGSHKVTFDADVAPGLQNLKKKIKLVGELYAE